MANFPDSVSTCKILQRLSRRSFVHRMATGAALATLPAIPEALAAPRADPRELVLLHAHKMAEAMNAVTGEAWEVNIRNGRDWVSLIDRGGQKNVTHSVKS